MTLPASGAISVSDINTELLKTATATLSLNDSDARNLAGIPTSGSQIAFSDFYGKTGRVVSTITLSTNTTDYTFNPSKIAGYIAGKTDAVLSVNSNIYLYATTTGTAALTISGWTSGDTVKIVNNGYIMGKGGLGGGGSNVGYNGGTAISLGYNITLDGSSYIAGGGGGGGGPFGGGGAGGGDGNTDYTYYTVTPGVGGGPGQSGTGPGAVQPAGAGGGRIIPGTGGTGAYLQGYNPPLYAQGGGAGGGGGCTSEQQSISAFQNYAGGGGGGWGASGGRGLRTIATAPACQGGTGGSGGNVGGGASAASGLGPSAIYAGGSGGYAIQLNGYIVTNVGSPTFYGTVG